MDAIRNLGITKNKVTRIENGRGLRLSVEAGAVWITQERSQDDICLSAGESCCIERDGMTLVSTLKVPFALVTLEPSMPTVAAL